MSNEEKDYTVLELQARWDKIRVANLYDTLDRMGYPNQCIDLAIRPLFPHQHLAGKAVTARGSRDMRTGAEIKADQESKKDTASFVNVGKLVFPGAVVVVDGGGDAGDGQDDGVVPDPAKLPGPRALDRPVEKTVVHAQQPRRPFVPRAARCAQAATYSA